MLGYSKEYKPQNRAPAWMLFWCCNKSASCICRLWKKMHTWHEHTLHFTHTNTLMALFHCTRFQGELCGTFWPCQDGELWVLFRKSPMALSVRVNERNVPWQLVWFYYRIKLLNVATWWFSAKHMLDEQHAQQHTANQRAVLQCCSLCWNLNKYIFVNVNVLRQIFRQ